MRFIPLFLVALLITSCAEAQVKVQDCTEDVSPSDSTDVLYEVKNWSTSPSCRKTKPGNVSKLSGWVKSGTTISPSTSTDNVVMTGNMTAGAYYGDGSHLSGVSAGGGGGGSGTVTSVSVTTANGVSGAVATSTTTPAITLTLGAITPTTIVASGAVSGSNLSGSNTGDQTIMLTGDVTGAGTGSFATTIGATKVTNAMLAGSITAAKLVSTDITSLGTIATGVWNGTAIGYAYGGTGLTAAADDNIMVGADIGWQSKPLPNCIDSSGNHLNYTASTNTWSCGTTSSSGVVGSDTQMIFNDGGSTLAGATALIYNKTNTASSGVQSSFTVSPTINQTSTAGYNGLYVNATETATGSGTNNLLNLAVAGSSKFAVSNTGAVSGTSYATNSTSAGSIQLNEASANGTNYIKFSSAASRSGDVTVILDGTDGTTETFPTTSQTLVGQTGTVTLTNKRITPRIGTETSSATSTPTSDSVDQWNITALAAADAFVAPTGTPTDGQKLVIRILDNGTARALTWSSASGGYIARGVALPSTTVISKYLYIGFIYNAVTSKWECIAVAQEA